jgi:hypothetical protein
MADISPTLFSRISDSYHLFMKSGYVDFYKHIFGSSQFPIWFTTQAIWSCYVVRLSWLQRKRSIFGCVRQFILAAMVTFGQRELFAPFVQKPSPIRTTPLSAVIFLVIFIILTFMPEIIIRRAIPFLYPFLAFLQSFNQVRFFTLILRLVKGYDEYQLVPIALVFTILDQVIEFLFRPFFGAEETPISNGGTIYGFVPLGVGYWFATHETQFTRFIGLHDSKKAALVFGFVLGLANVCLFFFSGKNECVERTEQVVPKSADPVSAKEDQKEESEHVTETPSESEEKTTEQ